MEHYFTNNPNLKSEIRELPFLYGKERFTFLSDNGVFAKNKVDYASEVLIDTFIKNHPDINKEATILDVGCGYGFVGIVISKILGVKADLIDINKRAIHLSERNIKLNDVKDCRVFESNVYENVENKYDYIITNPPIRAGKEIVLKILKEAREHLNPGGELWFVINKDQGAKSTKKALEECYNIEVIEKSKGFYYFMAKIN